MSATNPARHLHGVDNVLIIVILRNIGGPAASRFCANMIQQTDYRLMNVWISWWYCSVLTGKAWNGKVQYSGTLPVRVSDQSPPFAQLDKLLFPGEHNLLSINPTRRYCPMLHVRELQSCCSCHIHAHSQGRSRAQFCKVPSPQDGCTSPGRLLAVVSH